ncbi:hypothetical protein CIPAW_16G094500 [Carya illinoinensis]|uniref:Disease resistance N-terminal domain-containing protein n=1 Tax=Carya illinoinensis TaxID=32201 RepID=A0A8T1N7H1_CARIL|nr:hypothetical protein CIPAW_16G094500 [Carya illinoinensis]
MHRYISQQVVGSNSARCSKLLGDSCHSQVISAHFLVSILFPKGKMVLTEVFLAASLSVLFERLASREFLDFAACRGGLRKRLDKWKKKLLEIQKVLGDAHDKQYTNREVKKWLEDVEDLAYDVEDILDELATEANLQRNLIGGGRRASTSTFCTSLGAYNVVWSDEDIPPQQHTDDVSEHRCNRYVKNVRGSTESLPEVIITFFDFKIDTRFFAGK